MLTPREDWTIGSGDVGSWGKNGNVAENTRVYGLNPWRQKSIIWVSKCDGVLTGTEPYEDPGEGESYADGGWNSPYPAIDPSQKYRLTWWTRRKYGGGGISYWGLYTYNSSYVNTANYRRSNGASSTNSYFYYTADPPTSADLPENEWVLVVGHVWPHTDTDTANDSDSGIWLLDGTKHRDISWEYRFDSTAAYLRSRTYMYYCIRTQDNSPFTTYGDLDLEAETRNYWPRMELVDGTEPTIAEIIRNANYQATMVAAGGLKLTVNCNELHNRG